MIGAMKTVVARHPFIELDPRGVAWVIGTTVKVREVVLEAKGYEWDLESVREGFPHWSMVNIHAALCYYFDNKDALDHEIEAVAAEVERWRLESPPGPTRAELLERLRLRESSPLPR